MANTTPSRYHTNTSPEVQTPTGDETKTFTERPRTNLAKNKDSQVAHDLFNLFTANIIKAKTDFIR